MPTNGRVARDKTGLQQGATFTPNPQQVAAIAHTQGPAAFIAAAGTGKTAILVARLVRLIAQEGVEPGKILCVTFTRAAAVEMEKRALRALKAHGKTAESVKGLRVVTFHGLGHQMLREKLGWTPRELNQALLSGDPRQWLAEDILRPWRSDRSRGMNWSMPVADLLAAVDHAKEALVAPSGAADFFAETLHCEAEIADRFQAFYQHYEATKTKAKRYDLADLIAVPLALLEGSPTFRKSWQGRFHYLQVDETQDTNPSQYRLVQHLALPHQNVVIVGDPDQAIYSFRGASPEASILSFKQMYPKGVIYPIEHNYRSTPQILAAANQLIANNPLTPGFEKQLRPTMPDGAPVMVSAFANQESEAEGIARQIEDLVRHTGQMSYREIFVLSRTNHHLASLELVLARQRIPFRSVGGSSFFKRKTTRDLLAYLALVDGQRAAQEYRAALNGPNPRSWEDVFTPVFSGEQNAAFRQVAYIPSKAYFARTGQTSHRFTPSFFATLNASAAGKPHLAYCEEHAYAIEAQYQLAVKDFVGLIREVAKTCQDRPAEAIQLIRQLAYDLHLAQRDSRHQDDAEDAEQDPPAPKEESRVENRFDELEELVRIAQRHRSIRHFLDAMRQLKEQAEATRKQHHDCVVLMTVHKSKGLEQRAVFVMGLVEGIFPHQRSFTMTTEDGPMVLSGIAEERRLAYVAFTRAQHRLFLSTLVRYRGGRATPSRFIDEAGLECVIVDDLTLDGPESLAPEDDQDLPPEPQRVRRPGKRPAQPKKPGLAVPLFET